MIQHEEAPPVGAASAMTWQRTPLVDVDRGKNWPSRDIYKRFVPSAGANCRDFYTVIILQISGFLHPTLKNVRNML